MDKPRSPTLRERIGGRWAVSWPAFIICLSFTSLSRLLDPLFAQPSVRMVGLLIDLVTFLVCFGGTMWLSTITVLRNRRVRPVPVALVAAVGFVAAASVIVAQDLVVTFVGMDGPGYVSRPWLVAAITGAIALCSIAYLLDARERFRSERDRLLTTLARSVDADATEQEALDLLRSQMWQYAASDAASALPSGATSTNDEVQIFLMTGKFRCQSQPAARQPRPRITNRSTRFRSVRAGFWRMRPAKTPKRQLAMAGSVLSNPSGS